MTLRFMVCSSTTPVYPANGLTGTSTAQRGTVSGATTTYTATGAVDSTVQANMGAGTLAGDYVFTADGFWGVITSYVGVANLVTITVDAWRNKLTGATGTPANGGIFTIHSATELTQPTGSGRIKPVSVIFPGGAATVTVVDANGAALLPAMTWAAGAPPLTVPLTGMDAGLGPIVCPVGLKVSAGSATLVYQRS